MLWLWRGNSLAMTVIVVLLGDNIFEYSIARYVEDFRNQQQGGESCLRRLATRSDLASLPWMRN